MADDKQIILKKKKIVHGGHHGGAWKVAYADFVTAMMALFILLWLMASSSQQTKEIIASYFRDPSGTSKQMGSVHAGSGNNLALARQQMNNLKQTLEQAIRNQHALDKLKNQIVMAITPEGLRIELMEDPKGTFFQIGSAQPTPILVELLKVMASQIGKLPSKISIEGHTDAAPYSGNQVYSNWELSSDRANVARRLMQANGLHQDQVAQVRGFAAMQLRDPAHPFSASNRRISLIVQWPDSDAPSPAHENPPTATASEKSAPAPKQLAMASPSAAKR